MEYYINIILSDINKELVFGVMRDFRIGGLNPENYDKFIKRVRALLKLFKEKESGTNPANDFLALVTPDAAIREKLFLIRHNLSEFNLTEVSKSDAARIWKRVLKIVNDKTQFCWHPNASIKTCTKDNDGKVKISSAHSIQHRKILKYLSENSSVKQFKLNRFGQNYEKPIKLASTFYGFCDRHDKMFDPIEKQDYLGDIEQNFLFAYRAFIHSSHIKLVFNEYSDYGSQALNDIENSKKIFNESILNKDYSRIAADVIVLETEYPIAVVSSSDLEYDYNGKEIFHSDSRLEEFFLTVFPQKGKTYIIFSYFIDDLHLYGDIINQVRKRTDIKSALSVLIAGHCENVFFRPSYYERYIECQEINIDKLIRQTQFDFVEFDGYGKKMKPLSFTPKNYLENEFNIQLFN